MIPNGLSDILRSLAATGHRRAHELREAADVLDQTIAGYTAVPARFGPKRYDSCVKAARELLHEVTVAPFSGMPQTK